MTVAQAIPGEFISIDVDAITQPFFDAGKAGKLTCQRCSECKKFRMPPTPFCPNCQSEAVEWVGLSGKGKLYTYAVCNRSPFPGLSPDITYIPAVVDLPDADNVRINTNLVEVEPADIRIGMEVDIFWSPITEGWSVPICRPAKAT
jgi:uncharacterized OB-fold protein